MYQEDLYAFHARTFGSPAPGQHSHTNQGSHNDAAHDESQVEDDDLGYYPDGAKRTLTDDQIAMFRHSEIYSILRERQVRKENLEAEGVEQSEGMFSQSEEKVEAILSSDEEGEVRSDGEGKEAFTTMSEISPQDMEATHAGKKRKRGVADDGYVHDRKYASRSARGFVRELDSAASEDHVLDYGDETPTAQGSKQNDFTATQVAEQDRDNQASPAEGKKIWWPIIEATSLCKSARS